MDFARLQTTSKVTDEWRYPQKDPRRSGMLPVDQEPDHTLYWEEYGNPDGEPVMFLHGGPGGSCSPVLSRFFDPARYRVVLFDQRGCGKSRPNVARDGPDAALAKNTTDELVADINRLRQALDITGKMHVFGGSWGSTLALVYAIRHPEAVASLVLRGIFLGEREDLLYMYQGNAGTWADQPFALTRPGSYVAYPDEWKAFVEVIPPEDRGDMMAAYKAIFDARNPGEAGRAAQLAAALAWSVWEGVISYTVPPTADPGQNAEADFALSFAQIEAHYFANDLFIEPGYVLDQVHRLAGIDIHIVHGRFDQVTPLAQASTLVAALEAAGSPVRTFIKTNAGHSALEGQTVIALTAVMDGLDPLDA
ncbi:prolyl aminopeptidase [Brevundimonas basaltis]|uniref:Proline iminopeptidase n=1 Tax=Brevundimonas basaltis TaxID=472166 RepID=A0A7W8I151_9CAUL|nr:prolyl aminopeptidase [Brevundimonas basaltis]MBB5292607.1 proline iminopeptidase [Brevundimonas basaltis]